MFSLKSSPYFSWHAVMYSCTFLHSQILKSLHISVFTSTSIGLFTSLNTLTQNQFLRYKEAEYQLFKISAFNSGFFLQHLLFENPPPGGSVQLIHERHELTVYKTSIIFQIWCYFSRVHRYLKEFKPLVTCALLWKLWSNSLNWWLYKKQHIFLKPKP